MSRSLEKEKGINKILQMQILFLFFKNKYIIFGE